MVSQKELQQKIQELEKEIKQLKSRKRYGLVWEEKEEIFDKDLKNAFPILTRKNDKNYPDITNKQTNKQTNANKPHILIEGDNYHTLNVLSYTHKNKINVIYIDPPYNTGNKDFIYNDKIVDKEDSFRHSKWLSFMAKRLRLARDLLTDDGVIFISIDDNEQAQLKLLCDEIFGEKNSLINSIWRKGNAQNDASGIQKNHEYVLGYFKNICDIKIKKYEEKTILTDDIGDFYLSSGFTTGGAGGTLNNRPNLGHSIYFKDSNFVAIDDYDKELAKQSNNENEVYIDREDLISKGYEVIRPPKKGNKLGRWTWSKDKFNNNKNNVFITDNLTLVKKVYINSKLVKNKKTIIEKYIPPNSIVDISSSIGSKLLNEILGHKVFENPKPKELINHFLLFKNKDITILDFFAGSGTTGHAVLELNKQDGGNRQFILCTNNENKICEDITYERIKRVMQGYTSKGKSVEGLGGELKYLKTDFVQKQQKSFITDEDKINLTNKTSTILALKENTFDEVKKDKRYQVFASNTKITAIYFSENKTQLDELIDYLNQQEKPVKLYLFSWTVGEHDVSEHKNIVVEDIPEPILEIYKTIGIL